MKCNRGDVFFVNFEPTVGGEIKKTRPAVIVSTDKANPYLNRVVVIPISSAVSKIYPSETRVVLSNEERKAMADQIRTVSKERLLSRIGTLSSSDMRKIEEKIKEYLEII